MIIFTLVFLHIKIPSIPSQAKEVTVETTDTRARLEEKPTYATPTPAIIVAAPANMPNPPIHLLRRALFAIATPEIIASVPWRIRNMLLIPISVHLIPSTTLKAMAFSSPSSAEGGEEEGIAYQVSTATLSAIPSTAYRMVKVLAATIVLAKPSHASAEAVPDSDRASRR